jgi:hypothetical protein
MYGAARERTVARSAKRSDAKTAITELARFEPADP